MQSYKQDILLTGATGFLGRKLTLTLGTEKLVIVTRSNVKISPKNFVTKNISGQTDYTGAFNGIGVVIHSAARAHVMKESSLNPLEEFREINTAGTLNLAKQAAMAGVKRFIFISSIKVHGEGTEANRKFKFNDDLKPQDAYGQSKAEAELGLKEIAEKTGLEVVIIRPPLVYGLGVKANFAAMMNLAKKNLPLPFGAIYNKRSLVSIENLVDLIITCIEHPNAANQTFLASDDHDISTTELLEFMTRSVDKKPILIPVPVSWLKIAGKLLGKQAIVNRLCGNLQVDINHTKDTLGWKPPLSVEEGIRRCFVKEEESCSVF